MTDSYLKLCFIFICILFSLWLHKRFFKLTNGIEHFSQNRPFVLKKDDNCYDEIYCKHYDQLYKSESHNRFFLEFIEKNKKIDKNTKILDIGCGSGNLLNSIRKTKFIFGIDKSADMINLANKKTNATLLQNDVIKDPLNYDNNYFDIITCTNNTIYEIDNKVLLLRYCFNWLKRGGILALHLVDPDNFNMVVPISDYYDKINELTDNRIYETELDFSDYTYKNNFVKQLDQIYIQKEEFVDKYSNHLRQYEKQIYFENINSILTIAKNIGFKIFKKENTINNLGDKHQYFVILFKPLSGEI